MKTRLLFGFIVILSSLWIGYAFWMVKNQTVTIVAHSYFSDNSPILFINRNDECAPIPEVQIGSAALSSLITNEFFSRWKTIGIQISEDGNETAILLEEQARIKDEEIINFLQSIGLNTLNTPGITAQTVNNWTVMRANGYLAIHNRLSIEHPAAEHSFSSLIINRDINSSYSKIDSSGVSDIYCHEGYRKTFRTANANLTISSLPMIDLDMYSVLPSNTQAFIFWEKDYLLNLDTTWNDSSILDYIDNGIAITNIDGSHVWLIDVSGKFTPQEIISQLALDKSDLQSQIIKLNRSFGSVRSPFAMGLENVLVLSENKSVLEQMRIAYQTGNLFIKSSSFLSIKKHGAHRVHTRWFHPEKISSNSKPNYISGDIGHAIYSANVEKIIIASTYFSDTPATGNSNQHSSSYGSGQVVWNFSLENKNSRFYTNQSNLCVINPDKKTVSIVTSLGKVATWIQLTGNLKTVHPMEGGFLIEQFDQLIWLADRAPFDKKEIPFKGAIASSIAPYVWKGVPSISLISENLLYRISLLTGKLETNKIPQNKQITDGQLHAFNLDGDLAFGVFTDSTLHIYNSKTNHWRTLDMAGDICWSQKIDGKIFYLSRSSEGYSYRELLKTDPIAIVPAEHPFVGATEKQNSIIFSFKKGNNVSFYSTASKQFISSTSELIDAEVVVPVIDNKQVIGFLELDGVRNELIVHKNISSIHEKTTLNASQFIKVIGTNSVITYVDGQLVMYSF